ncbi:HdaA/DnaA family protein [Derxia gummosa]|uniref:HdaA/DnaA family protein n=1 Tax=Derxia gummosa DSM 723 TaxID=1121388 RepID=A0A8B6XAW7_9BURK|nr:DnaA/Hda family protein [Derxia gummosa]
MQPRQYALELLPEREPTLDNFLPGANAELIDRLRRLDFPRVLYVWGPAGSGKSHLIAALKRAHPDLVTADDVDRAGKREQNRLFDAYNEAVIGGPALVVAGNCPPRSLGGPTGKSMREDLRTRLAAGLVYQLHPLDDADKRRALAEAARARGVEINDDVVGYLLNHFARDLGSLMRVYEAIDRHALESRRAITMALVRDWVARSEDGAADDGAA